MLKNLALLLSLCANAGLLAAALLGASSTPAAGPFVAVDVRPAAASERRSAADPAAYYTDLMALGLDEHEAKLLLGARLEELAMAKLPPAPDRYWEPRQAELERYGAGVLAAQAAVRRELETVLGASAERAPELARVFRPLGARLAFLSSQQQAAVQGWLTSRRVEPAPAPAGAVAAGSAATSEREADFGGEELAQLRRVLPSDAAFEVALRESALAEQLRSSGAKLTEAEFRDAYAVLAEPADAHDVAALVERRRRLRALLGQARFDRVWAIRDPLAAVVRNAARERGMDEADTFRAYGVLNANQGRLTELAASGDLRTERTATAAQAIAVDEQTELARAVGEDNARAILNARNAYFVAASRAARPQRSPAADQ